MVLGEGVARCAAKVKSSDVEARRTAACFVNEASKLWRVRPTPGCECASSRAMVRLSNGLRTLWITRSSAARGARRWCNCEDDWAWAGPLDREGEWG
jgi:hypothetical protein